VSEPVHVTNCEVTHLLVLLYMLGQLVKNWLAQVEGLECMVMVVITNIRGLVR